mmetsp:Transcript_31647/g.99229  ORF Transcript_31647/g.99229 Transcript_31647/m.99229 type:complete len:269 (-) Transcript_31647:549-1355(-)
MTSDGFDTSSGANPEHTAPMDSSPPSSCAVRTSKRPTWYMRKRAPSSVVLSKEGAMDFKACLSFAASVALGERTSLVAPAGAACSRASPKLDAQSDGNSGPAESTWKSALKKCAFRCCLVASSSRKRPRNMRRYSGFALGGTKLSPSSRLSESFGLNRAFNQRTSSAAKTEPVSRSRLDQKASPKAPRASIRSAPSASEASTLGVERLKLSRLRSTPRGWRGATTAPPVICAKEVYWPGSSERAVTALKRGTAANAPTISSTPNCTPP